MAAGGGVGMGARRDVGKDVAEKDAPFDFAAAYQELSLSMSRVHISRFEELPRIDLYLDQVLALVADELSFIPLEGEKLLTGSMVNNYVKQGLVPAPERKRYSPRHVAYLLFVCSLKRSLSIAQVADLLSVVDNAQVDLLRAYNDLVSAFEVAIAQEFSDGPKGRGDPVPMRVYDVQGVEVDDGVSRLLTTGIRLLASKVYVDHVLELQSRRLG